MVSYLCLERISILNIRGLVFIGLRDFVNLSLPTFKVLLLFTLLPFLNLSQSPGNEPVNLELWLKGDAGVVGGASVSQWNDFSGNGHNATQAIVAERPDGTVNLFNYNRAIDFDGIDDHMELPDSILAVGDDDVALYSAWITNSNVSIQRVVSFGQNTAARGVSTQLGKNGGFGGQNFGCQVEVSPYSQGILVPYFLNRGTISTVYTRNTAVNDIEVAGNGGAIFTATVGEGVRSIRAIQNTIGQRSSNTERFSGRIGEIVVYSSPHGNMSNERYRIETYLGVKYSITLAHNYLNSVNGLIWDIGLNPAYNNGVIGIGRDDLQALSQKQSHTIDDSTRIYISSLSNRNDLNTGTINNDKSFVITGHNDGAMCATLASNAEMPAACPLFSKLEREWKVTKSNFSQTFNMDFTLGTCAILGSVNPGNLRLLVDDDGDFSNGGTTCYYNGDGTGIIISYVNPVITVSNIGNTHIVNNSTAYITLASVDSVTPLPVELVDFEASPIESRWVDLKWQTASEKDNDYFEIYKSIDLNNWEFVAQVAAVGNSSELLDYSTEDLTPYMGLSYYELIQVDYNGESKSGGIRSVVIKSENGEDLSIYPNPTSGELKIMGEKSQLNSLQLFNAIGQRVKMRIIANGSHNITVDISRIPSGVYFLRSNQKAYKIVKE